MAQDELGSNARSGLHGQAAAWTVVARFVSIRTLACEPIGSGGGVDEAVPVRSLFRSIVSRRRSGAVWVVEQKGANHMVRTFGIFISAVVVVACGVNSPTSQTDVSSPGNPEALSAPSNEATNEAT